MTARRGTDATVSRRGVLETVAGLALGSTALAGLGARRGAATPDRRGPVRVELRERNEAYVAAEVRFPSRQSRPETGTDAHPDEVYLGAADQFVVHDDEDAVSLPEDADRLANPVAMEPLDADETGHGKLMYFRSEDVVGYSVPDVTLGLGLFTERTIPGTKWDTCPGLWIDVRDRSEDHVTVAARLPDGMSAADGRVGSDILLGPADEFVVHEGRDAVSLPEDADRLVRPVEMDFENPHDVTMHFRTDDVDFSKVADFVGQNYVEIGLGLFTERTIPGSNWATARIEV